MTWGLQGWRPGLARTSAQCDYCDGPIAADEPIAVHLDIGSTRPRAAISCDRCNDFPALREHLERHQS